jgi:hypothetical protein
MSDWGAVASMPKLRPLFPVRSFEPGSPCPHGELPSHTVLCCMVCHKTGGKAQARIDRLTAKQPDPSKAEKKAAGRFRPKGKGKSKAPKAEPSSRAA